MNLIEANHIEKSFGSLQVLRDISMHVAEGEVVAIIGPSGSGKSTFLRCLTQLETADRGEITICGKQMMRTENGKAVFADPKTLQEIILCAGLVFQNFNLFPHRSVLQNVSDAPVRVLNIPRAQAEQTARDLLDKMNLANRADYGHIDIVYGSRSKEDLVDIDIIRDVWMKAPDVDVHLTIDRPQDDWDGHVGFVPAYVTELGFDPNKTVLVCGPPIMIKFTLQSLGELGFEKTQVYTTMELRMKCGVGKCGRCNIGTKYVCKDGPVFRFDQLDELPDEY